MVSETEKLMARTEQIKIGERQYTIGRLTVGQSIMLGRIIVEEVSKMSADAKKKLEGGKTSADDVFSLFDMADETVFIKVMGIVLKEKDIDFLGTALDLGDAAKIVQVVLKYNDFGKMWGNVAAAVEEVKKQALSPRSSELLQRSPATP